MSLIKLMYFTNSGKEKIAELKVNEDDSLEIISISDYDNPIKKIKIKEPKKQNKEKISIKKIFSYLKAEFSQAFKGKVTKKIFIKRKELCLSCDKLKKLNNSKETIGWCGGGCGCNVGAPRAALSQKLYMPNISCPLNKFGPEKGSGINLNDFKNSVFNIIKVLKFYLFKKN